jgi:PGF-pre-PGF domain-containing protein
MKGRLTILILIITLIVLFPTFSEDVYLDEKIIEEFDSNEEVPVVIKYKEEPKQPSTLQILFTDEIEQAPVIEEFYQADISENQLEDLLRDDNVESIALNGVAQIYLDDSSVIQNASTVNAKQYSSTNLTGLGYSVCVIDSGVNATHPSLNGRVVAEYCYCSAHVGLGRGDCCPDGTAEDNNAEDNNGHGTHVAGIIASNDTTYTGVAPQANIVAVKATDSGGNAIWSDIASAISWCNTNRETYNITAISMSIGGGEYSSHCDAVFTGVAITSAVNTAHNNNVSVVMSTGNNASTNNIGGPSCINNVIAVSSSTKSDTVSSFSNRNSITDIFAIGGTTGGSAACPNSNFVCSARYDTTGFIGYSGTSMSTPQVSGAIALLQQYEEQVEGQKLSADQVNATITQNGATIDDSGGSGYTFFRLDVLASLLAIDNLQPAIIQPNITQNFYYHQNATITVNITDVNLDTVFLEGNWTGTQINYSMTQDGDQFNYTIHSDNFSAGEAFSWRIYANDSAGNLNTSNIFTNIADAGGPQVTLNAPANNSIIDKQTVTFNFTADDEIDLQFNCTLLIDSSYNQTNLTVLDNNLTNFNINLTDNTYTWNIECLDSSNNSITSVTRTITIDTLPPIFNIETYNTTLELGNNQTYTVNITNTHLSYANFSYNALNQTMTNSSDNYTITFMTFQNGTNIYTVHAYDTVNNQNSTNGTFIVQDTISGPRMTNLQYNATVNQGENQTIYLWLLNQFDLSSHNITINNTAYILTNNTFYNFTYTWNTTYCGDTNFTIFSNSSDASYTQTINYSVNMCCGNGIPENSETCSNCPADVGVCAPSSTSSGGGGGGGGGGGSATTEEPTKRTLLISSASPSTPIEFEIDSENIPVNKVEITVEQEVSDIKVSVESLDARPSSVTIPEGELFNYLEISTKNLLDQDIEDAEISFIIDEDWIEDNDINLDSILLQRYNSGWEQLATEYIKKSGSNYYFNSETDGFSYFAITGEENIIIEETIGEVTEQEITTDAIQEPTQAPEEQTITQTYIKQLLFSLAGIIVLLVLIIVIILRVKQWKTSADKQ